MLNQLHRFLPLAFCAGAIALPASGDITQVVIVTDTPLELKVLIYGIHNPADGTSNGFPGNGYSGAGLNHWDMDIIVTETNPLVGPDSFEVRINDLYHRTAPHAGEPRGTSVSGWGDSTNASADNNVPALPGVIRRMAPDLPAGPPLWDGSDGLFGYVGHGDHRDHFRMQFDIRKDTPASDTTLQSYVINILGYHTGGTPPLPTPIPSPSVLLLSGMGLAAMARRVRSQ